MKDLIKQLEAATEGSLDLDCEIHKALNPLYVQNSQWPALFLHAGYSRSMAPGESRSHQVPHYTRSLDDALTLVPKGHEWRIWAAKAEIWQNGEPPTHFLSEAPTPALALCIAALRARNEGEGRA